jgi:tetratricopeptide (TPR) repeat protein
VGGGRGAIAPLVYSKEAGGAAQQTREDIMSTEKPGNLFEKAVACFNAGETDKAFELFRQVVELDADFQEEGRDNPHFYLGYLHSRKGEIPQAIACYTRSLKLWADDENSLEGRGICYRESGEYQKALNDFSAIFSIDANYRQMPSREIYEAIWDTAVLMGRQHEMLKEAASNVVNDPSDSACERLATYLECRLDACTPRDLSDSANKQQRLVRKIVQSIHQVRLLRFQLDDAFDDLALSAQDRQTLQNSYTGIESIAFDLERKILTLDSLDREVREELSGRWLFTGAEEEVEI